MVESDAISKKQYLLRKEQNVRTRSYFKKGVRSNNSKLYERVKHNAVLENSWNLASSLIVDNDLTAESLVASLDFDQGANDIALKIAELGNGEFSKDISDINADLGNSLADLNDNIDHQKTIEDLLLEQRNAVSSVSIDEEVADLMQFQRSFQASSRVLNTLDKMLELVVMGLIK
jgi:flagellar hook-associated protein 1 FlgK